MTSVDRDGFSTPLSADAVRAARFPTQRRGFDPEEVQLFLHQVAREIQAADAERAELRAELQTARATLEELRRKERTEPEQEQLAISAHAVGLLSQAQQIADGRVAEAEQYARDLIEAARGQYQEVLRRAQQAADSVRELPGVKVEAGLSAQEVEYVRTYARVAQVQLRSVLDALSHEVDKLGKCLQADEYRQLSAPSSDDLVWQPADQRSHDGAPAGVSQAPSYFAQPYA